MASDSRNGGRSSRPVPSAPHPNAPRPSAAEWSILREDGIQWEGQVLLTGVGVGLPALLVLTTSRLVLATNGQVALDVPRTWLRPEPKLLTGGNVRLSVTPHSRASQSTETDRLTVTVRSGRSEAARLVSVVTGRVISPREERNPAAAEQPGAWKHSVGAATPMALPPLPDFDDDPALVRANRVWPPIEAEGVPKAEPRRRKPQADPDKTLSSWIANHDPDAMETPARAATHRNPTWPVEPAGPAEDRRQFNRGLVWGLRSLILALLVGTAVYFGHDRLPGEVNFRLPAALEDRFGLNEDDPAPTDVSQLGQVEEGSDLGPVATTPSEDGTSGAPNGDAAATEDGLGGNQGDIEPVDPDIGTYADDETQVEEPTVEAPVVEPTVEAPVVEPTVEAPVVEPTLTPETPESQPEDTAPAPEATESNTVPVGDGDPTDPVATEIPVETEAPVVTEEPVVIDEPAETVIPEETETPIGTEVPVETDVPATETPSTETPVVTEEATEIPGRDDTTPTVEVETPTVEVETPAVETETPPATLEPQAPSVNPEVPPAQEVTSGAFRYAVTGAEQGETIAALPDLAAVDIGEWVVLTVAGQNTSDTEQVFDMSQFKLYADGQEVLLDVGNAWVSGLLGQTPAYGNTDAILWAGGEGHSFTLTFLAPNGTQELVLVAGDQTLDLSKSLESAALTNAADAVTQPIPEALEATVVGVVDAETIVVEIDGIRQTVRYLGVDVPTGDDCFAAESLAANQALVEGQTVRLERQATDVDARGNWVRDVWVANADGGWTLVSEALVSDGAATAGISTPNIRFAGWLESSQATAEAAGSGLWGACTGDVADDMAEAPVVLVPSVQRGNI